MTVETTKDVLLWCAIINYTAVLLWFLPIAFARERIHRLWGRWFRLTAEQFDALSFRDELGSGERRWIYWP